MQSADAITGRRYCRAATYRTAELFTVLFYGLRIFGRKTAQLCVTQCEWLTTETPSISDAVQRSENTRKKSLLNYESPALTAELQAQFALDLIMRIGC